MYGKDEIKNLRVGFWEGFQKYSTPKRRKLGKPRKWIMQNTGIKAIDLKFEIDQKRASVGIDVVSKSLESKLIYWNKFLGLKALLDEEFDHKLIWDDMYTLESGKDIIRIAMYMEGVDILDESCWKSVYEFFFKNMIQIENWFDEYKDILKIQQGG